jgi:hypothetical protein
VLHLASDLPLARGAVCSSIIGECNEHSQMVSSVVDLESIFCLEKKVTGTRHVDQVKNT